MQRRTTIWFLLLFQAILICSQNRTESHECKIGSFNPLAVSSLNACFKLYDTPKSYQGARRHCVSLGGQLADRINKDDSSLYSANADLEVANGTKFWVGASNLKCNIAWENDGEIEYNEMWAPNSRYYGVAIEKMSLGGLWYTIPVGQKLPFVCTFQGKSRDATAPVHAMRAPAKKRTVEKAKEDDIDESLNAALADERKKAESKSENKKEAKKDEDEINESMNAALSDEKKKSEAMAMSESNKEETSNKDEETNSEEASISAQQATNASAALSASMSASSTSSNSSSDSSLEEMYDSAEIAMRKEIGRNVVAMKSQEMASQSEDYDKYTEEDLLSAAASAIGGYTVNVNWADSRTTNTSSFDSQTDEESMSMSMTVADQMAMAMQSSNRRASENSRSDSMSESSSDQMREESAMAMNAAMQASEKSLKKSESSSKDESEDSASMSMEQKAEVNAKMEAASASNSQSNKSDQKETVETADIASAAKISKKDEKKSGDPKATTKISGTTEEPDIDESLNAALVNQRSFSTTKPDLTTVLTTINPGNALAMAVKSAEKLPGCPAEWTQFNTNATSPALCFRRFEKSKNFEDARLFCVSKGGHLASIHNERQLLLLSALLHNNGPDALSDQTWIGLNRIHQKYYVYEDETPMDFTRWLPGAPNINDCTVFTGNELPNYPHKGTQYKFGDFPCEETQKSVLCEVVLGKDKTNTQPTCQEGWSYYSHDGTAKNGKCYKRIDQSKKFSEAREVCKLQNSYVASVQNEGEARFVSALVQTEKNYTVDEQTWIGYVKYDRDFGWEDGNQGLHFDPWTEKMPREKKCTVFTGNEIHDDCRSQFRFASVDCSKNQRSILCSKPPMINGVPFAFKDTGNSSKKI